MVSDYKPQVHRTLIESVICKLEGEIPATIQTYPRMDHPDPKKRADAFRCLVSVIISQRTTLQNEVRAQERLFHRFRTPSQLATAPSARIERLIKPAGLATVKARRIKKISKEIMQRYNGDFDKLRDMSAHGAREELMSLPGIGPKSADCILLWGLRKQYYLSMLMCSGLQEGLD